jgi:cysteine desulfuration protein SufE
MSTAVHTIDEVIELFDLFGDNWEERYRYLIDLGKTVPDLPEELRVESNLVPGCTSRVWMASSIEDGIFRFQADSDAHLVKGLIGVLMILFNNRPAGEIVDVDVRGIFQRLGLEQNLSPNRRNGFYSMVERIRGSTLT